MKNILGWIIAIWVGLACIISLVDIMVSSQGIEALRILVRCLPSAIILFLLIVGIKKFLLKSETR